MDPKTKQSQSSGEVIERLEVHVGDIRTSSVSGGPSLPCERRVPRRDTAPRSVNFSSSGEYDVVVRS